MSNFEAQSHSLFSRCLRLATTITGSHPRLATGGWLDLTRQAFHLLDYSPLSGRTIPICLLLIMRRFAKVTSAFVLEQLEFTLAIEFGAKSSVKKQIGVRVFLIFCT